MNSYTNLMLSLIGTWHIAFAPSDCPMLVRWVFILVLTLYTYRDVKGE